MLDIIQIDFIIGIDTIPVRHRSHHPLFSLPQHVLFLLLVRRRFGKTDLQIGATEILSKLKKQIMNIFFAPPHLPFSLKEEFLRMRDSYKRFVKTWIRFANPWIRIVS